MHFLPMGFEKDSGLATMKVLLLPLLFLSLYSAAQAVINIDGVNCNVHGLAKPGSEVYYLNELKNRYTFPQSGDFDTGITFQSLMQSGDPNQFSPTKAVRLQGYVVDVKMGGVESCNCKTKNPAFRDTHIELTPDETKTGPQNRIIVEVTPRLRALMAKRGKDWSTTSLRRSLKGRYIEISGWLLYDAEHETGAFANDSRDAVGAQNWRATCWEMHPVTSIEPANSGSVISNNKKQQPETKTTPPSTDQQGNSNFKFFLIGLIIGIVLLALLLSRSRRR